MENSTSGDQLTDRITAALARADGNRWTHATEARRNILRQHYSVAVQAVITSLGVGTDDTMAAWIYNRFAPTRLLKPWDSLPDEEKDYWQHEADAVKRAVARGGFKKTRTGGRI